ncbi:MAG: hypothetical protein OIF57_14245 [Marinobacterium sp.]|nr:hypothetical protein [Marinobacterium sp.]
MKAADEAHRNATHSESAAETRYDTLGLENAYLAHGQSMRASTLQHDLSNWHQWQLPDFDMGTAIAKGALIQLTTLNMPITTRWFLLSPWQGGLQFKFHTCSLPVITQNSEAITTITTQEVLITLVSPDTPVGQRLTGAFLEDEITLPDGNHYVISALY